MVTRTNHNTIDVYVRIIRTDYHAGQIFIPHRIPFHRHKITVPSGRFRSQCVFMYSKVTPKSISQIKIVTELETVCREISYIESGVSFAKKVEKLCIRPTFHRKFRVLSCGKFRKHHATSGNRTLFFCAARSITLRLLLPSSHYHM